jgi:hypothetical protein
MSLLVPTFHPKDLVELASGSYMVLTRRIGPGVLMGRPVVPWTNPQEPKPKVAPEIQIAESTIKQIVKDEVVSWVSPAHLHLTTDLAFKSEYDVVKRLADQHGPLILCHVSDDPLLGQTNGVYITADCRIFVTSRPHTRAPLQAVLRHVASHFSSDGIPALPGIHGSIEDLSTRAEAENRLAIAIGSIKTSDPEFQGDDVEAPDERWWTRQVGSAFVSAIIVQLKEKWFVNWCEQKFLTESDLRPELASDVREKILSNKKQQFRKLYASIVQFNREAIPSCLAWLSDDRWSANSDWQTARRLSPGINPPLRPEWSMKSGKSFAADVATRLEEFISDEQIDADDEVVESELTEISAWDARDEGAQFHPTGIRVPLLAPSVLTSFVGAELGVGIVEVTDSMELQWTGGGLDDRASLLFSEPGLLVVEGAAGTGKTMLMAHRAVDAAGRVPRVLVVVPTHTFKRRLKFILRRVGYKEQNFRRNNIEVLTPDLVGGSLRDAASKKAYRQKDMSWGRKRYKRQWDQMVKLAKANADPGQQPDVSSQYISRNIAIQEMNLYAKFRERKIEGDASLQVPSYGAIFVDEAQDLMGWDWLKLASYSIQYSIDHDGLLPEIGVFVDRRQDLRSATPNFDFAGPDDDPDFGGNAQEDDDVEDEDQARSRAPVVDPTGVLRTPLFDITRPGSATNPQLLVFRWAPEKSLQRYAIGYRNPQAIRKSFIQLMKGSQLPVKMQSLTVILRQTKSLAEQSAKRAIAIEAHHGLWNSLRNTFPISDEIGVTPVEVETVRSMSHLLDILSRQIETSQGDGRLAPRAIMAKHRVDAIALSLFAARVHRRVQSNIIVERPNNTTVKDRNGKTLVGDEGMVRHEPLAPEVLGPNVLGLFVPDKPPGGHRGLHRIGRDCRNYGAMRMSNGLPWVSVGTVAGLKGLEYGSLTAIKLSGQQLAPQEEYVLMSRPRTQLSLIHVNSKALHDSNQYKCATLINSCLPPWGGLIVCQLATLASIVSDDWERIKAPLEDEVDRLKKEWREASGAYGIEDECYKIWGMYRQVSTQEK